MPPTMLTPWRPPPCPHRCRRRSTSHSGRPAGADRTAGRAGRPAPARMCDEIRIIDHGEHRRRAMGGFHLRDALLLGSDGSVGTPIIPAQRGHLSCFAIHNPAVTRWIEVESKLLGISGFPLLRCVSSTNRASHLLRRNRRPRGGHRHPEPVNTRPSSHRRRVSLEPEPPDSIIQLRRPYRHRVGCLQREISHLGAPHALVITVKRPVQPVHPTGQNVSVQGRTPCFEASHTTANDATAVTSPRRQPRRRRRPTLAQRVAHPSDVKSHQTDIATTSTFEF